MLHLSDLVSTDGGLSILLLDGILFVPWVMALLFYPVPTPIGGAVVALLTGGYLFVTRQRP
jgi:hypothetical protein